MIQANELRIGNWVAEVVSKCPLYVREVLHNGISYECEHIVYDFFEYDKIDPILIWPETLEKAGFYRKKNSSIYKLTLKYEDSDYPCTLQKTGDGFQICRSGIGAITAEIKYLHQLQNLYHSLTGKELEIKL